MRIGDVLILDTGKDGGPKSRVDGFWILRIKWLCSIAILRFAEGSREAYHSHAFWSISWVLRGQLEEHVKGTWGNFTRKYLPSFMPVITPRSRMHKVYGRAPNTWVLTFRGPWAKTWQEIDESGDHVTLTHNRVEVSRSQGFS